MSSSGLEVKLHHGGNLRGRHLSAANDRVIRAFLGIPYAKPPVGKLRFEPPVPYPPWQGTKEAVKEGHICPQFSATGLIGDEDCLFLNVYTPDVKNISKLLPVMIFFHGGGWISGSGNCDSYGPEFFLEHDIILVTGNYRLGALGFLSTETPEYPGNNAFRDQLEIMKWVKENIHSFGGDPSSVTIFGESAGSHSVSNHLQSPLSRGYFHKVIHQSGSLFNGAADPAKKGKVAQNTLKLAKNLNCYKEGDSVSDAVERLKEVDPSKILAQESTFYEWMYYPICPFQSVLEVKGSEAFISETPRESGLKHLDIPIMIGFNSDEGLVGSVPIISNDQGLSDFKKEVRSRYPLMFAFDHLDKELQEKIKTEIDDFYFKEGYNYDKDNHRNLTNLFSDSFFISGFDEYLEQRLSQKSAPTYVYVFDQKPPVSLTSLIGGGNHYYGVSHGDELPMLFPYNKDLYPTAEYTEKDVIMRKTMVEMWVNFAKYGNPTPPGSSAQWKPATKYPWNYVQLGSQINDDLILENKTDFPRDGIEFWKKVNRMIAEGEQSASRSQ